MPSHTKKEKAKNKKNKNKAKPSDLGSGAASRAGSTLKNRRAQQLEAIMNAPTGGKKRKKMKKTKGRR